jgi:tetratricopeptide (TPR) repeat protein
MWSSASLKMYRGSFCGYLGRNEASHRLLGEAAALAEEAGLLELLGDIYLCHGFTFFRQADYISSTALYQSALNLCDRVDSGHLRGHGLWGIGKNLMIRSRYQEALPWLEKSLAVFEAEDSPLSVATVWSELAVCYLGMGDDQKAVELFRRCEQVDYEAGLMHGYQIDLANITRA